MSTSDTWKKAVSEKVGDIIKVEDLDQASAEHFSSDMRPEELIRKLSEAQQWPDAIKVMARALPVREAVWWACVCARQMESLAEDQNEMMALEAAEKWVYKPSDENRRAAMDVIEGVSDWSTGSLAALGVALSSGTIPVADNQYVDTDALAFTQTLEAAVMLAVTRNEKEQLTEIFTQILCSGEDIACGGNGLLDPVKR